MIHKHACMQSPWNEEAGKRAKVGGISPSRWLFEKLTNFNLGSFIYGIFPSKALSLSLSSRSLLEMIKEAGMVPSNWLWER